MRRLSLARSGLWRRAEAVSRRNLRTSLPGYMGKRRFFTGVAICGYGRVVKAIGGNLPSGADRGGIRRLAKAPVWEGWVEVGPAVAFLRADGRSGLRSSEPQEYVAVEWAVVLAVSIGLGQRAGLRAFWTDLTGRTPGVVRIG